MTEASDAPEFRFTREDFDELTDAVSRMAVSDHLPKGQWGLLLSIFAAAARSVEVENETEGKFPGVKVDGVIEDPRNKEVKALREQLRGAHMPGNDPSGPLGAMVQPPKTPPDPIKT
jgi:hypothetical protein